MAEEENGAGRRATDSTGEPTLDPAAGRIMGAGSNNLQRSIDANTRAQEQLIAELRKEREEKASRGGGRKGARRGNGGGGTRTTSVSPLGPAGAGDEGEEKEIGRWSHEMGFGSDGSFSRSESRTVNVPKMAVPIQQQYQLRENPDGSRTVTSYDQAPRGPKDGTSRKRTTTVDARGFITHDDWSNRQHGSGFTVPIDLEELHKSTPRQTRWVNSGRTVNADTGYSTYRSDGAAAYRAESSGEGSRVFVSGPSGPATLRRPGSAQNETFQRADGGFYSSRSRTVPLPGGLQREETYTEERGADGGTVRTTSVRAPRDDGRGFSTRVRTTTTSRTGRVSRSENVRDELTDLDDDQSDQWNQDRFHGGWGPTGGDGPGGPEEPAGSPPNWRNLARNVSRGANKMSSWGGALVKMGIPLDNYAQWSAIAGGGVQGDDGTSGSSVNNLRKAMFGSEGRNTINWAQGEKDATAAAFIASRNSGYTDLMPGTTDRVNPQMTAYMQNIKAMAYLDPTANAAQLAGTMGTLTSNRGTYGALMYGYEPVLGRGGEVDRDTLGRFSDSIMQRTFGNTSIKPEELKASLGQNGSLHANIRAYVNTVGGDDAMVKTIEDYMLGRNTAASKGLSSAEFDQLLSDYAAGGKEGEKAEERLKKFGVGNSILQSQKDKDAAKTSSVNDFLDQLGPAVKLANEALETFHNWLNEIVNTPGIKQALGGSLGWGSVFGPAVGSMAGAMAGMRMAGGGAAGLMSAAGGLMGMRPVTGTGGTAVAGPRGAMAGRIGASAMRGGLWGLGALGVSSVGGLVEDQVESEGGKTAVSIGTSGAAGALGGAGIGSMIAPGIGTGIGALIGGLGGLAYGAYQNFAGSEGHTTGNDGIGGGNENNKGDKKKKAASGKATAGKTAGPAINAAMAEVGKPYLWGGVGPDAWDCSGLMRHAYQKAGVRLPRTSQQQMLVGKAVKRKDARPGDLMFPHPGHVVMYLGGGKIVEAPRPGKNVRVTSVNDYKSYQAVRRIVGSVGTYNSSGNQDDNTEKPQTGNAGGNSGSMVMGDAYGSAEESEVIESALAGVQHTLLTAPMGHSDSDGDEDSKDEDAAVRSAPSNPKGNAALGKKMAAQRGWAGKQWDALFQLWTKESNWNHKADNPGSDAYGIPQAMSNQYPETATAAWRNSPAKQIKWGLDYIKRRYGTPQKAWNHWQARVPIGGRDVGHWYDKGAWEIPHDQPAVVHKGEMIIEKPKADAIRQVLMRDVVNTRDASTGRSSTGSGGFSSSGVTINFQHGSVQFLVNGAVNESTAREAAASFAMALSEDSRMKSLAKGL